jgi:dTDP-4-dehydrorhamnose 3,5-epimerase
MIGNPPESTHFAGYQSIPVEATTNFLTNTDIGYVSEPYSIEMSEITKLNSTELLARFEKDKPQPSQKRTRIDRLNGQIEGCTAWSLSPMSDHRGDLFELLTLRDQDIDPIVHVYQVFSAPGSIRAWVYHSKQTDRLCYTDGLFRIALFDLRAESPTCENLVTLLVGADAPTFLSIPPFVAHGVQNLGSERVPFLNLPTRVYHLDDPDKYRLPFDSPLIPFKW